MPDELKTPILQENGVRRRQKRKADTALLRRAVRERWPIPIEKRPEIVRRLIKTAIKNPDAANAMRAVEVLVAMDGQNQADQLNREKNERLEAGRAAERMGAEPVIIERPVSLSPRGILTQPMGD